MPSRLSRWLRSRWVWAAAAYAAAALVVTYPLLFNFTTHLAGSTGGASDTLEFVWSTWWWPHALFDLGQNPAHLTTIQYPAGMDFPLLPLMAQSFLLAMPITVLAGPAAGYNTIFLLSFVLCGLAGYALCTEVSGSRRAGFIGGLIWAFFPNKLGHAVTGHLFQLVVFAFPLATLAWQRLWRAPSYRRAVWAALALALASTVHPIYIAYFVLPLLVVGLVGVVYPRLRSMSFRGAGFAPRNLLAWRSFLLALGLYALIMVPLVLPALIQTLRGSLAFLAPESGSVELSLDALSFIVPAPRNPLVALTPLADLARALVSRENETLGYVGWAALALAVVGVRRQRSVSMPWLALALLGAVLALGPLLKAGGELVRVTVDGNDYPLPLPYALLARLPFFEWSRAPGRLAALVMLGVSVLAALGWARLEIRFSKRRARWLAAALSALILIEYLVVFPFPLTPAAQPEPVAALAAEADGRAVLQLPMPDSAAQQRALYWQTLHEHPLIGGRVYRDVPGGQDLSNFLGQLLTAPLEASIVPAPADGDSLAVLAALEVGWVIYDAQADAEGVARAALVDKLGEPRAGGDGAALFAVPLAAPPSPEALVWAIGPGWISTEQGLRLPAGGARVYAYAARAWTGQLRLSLRPEAELARVGVRINGQPAADLILGRALDDLGVAAALLPGLNVIEFLPMALDGSSAGLVNSGVVISRLDWQPGSAAGALAIFGDTVELSEYRFLPQARSGDDLVLDLAWRLQTPVSEDLVFFVHLLDAGGEVAAQIDGPPLGARLPTTGWPAGALVADQVTLPLPANLLPGDYTVTVGIYHWPSLERLPAAGSLAIRDERVVLGFISVP